MEEEWNDGYYFEGMDRCHTIRVMIDELLTDHPAIKSLPGGVKRLEKIDRLLGKIYQGLGALDEQYSFGAPRKTAEPSEESHIKREEEVDELDRLLSNYLGIYEK
jgi:hypothetical protein